MLFFRCACIISVVLVYPLVLPPLPNDTVGKTSGIETQTNLIVDNGVVVVAVVVAPPLLSGNDGNVYDPYKVLESTEKQTNLPVQF